MTDRREIRPQGRVSRRGHLAVGLVTGYKTVMHDLPLWLVLWLWCHALLSVGTHAASALPLITALTLLIGRRGRARLCALGAARLARLGYALAWLGPLAMAGSYVTLLVTLRGADNALPPSLSWLPPCCRSR